VVFEGCERNMQGGEGFRLGDQGDGQRKLKGFVLDFEALVFGEYEQNAVVHHQLNC
jgi:hypothetical protein